MKTIGCALIGTVLMVGAGCSEPANSPDEATEQVGQALDPAPVAYWKFDTCWGNVVPNEQGAWGVANLLNGAECKPGAFATAGFFDGVDDRAEIPYDSRLDFTTAMTISAWVKPHNVVDPQTIVGKWYAPDSYLLWLSDGYYRFSVALYNGTTASVAAPATADAWAQVVGTFGDNFLKLYVNGSLIASVDTPRRLQSSTRPVTIGNHPSWNPFRGRIDEVKLFDVDINGFNLAPSNCAGCNPPSSCCDP